LDRCSRDAQDILLTYLDKLPPGKALIGTSNLQLDLLTERFQTRFQSIKITTPTTEELAEFLCAHWRVPRDVAARVAVGSGGCVRAALADLETWLEVKEADCCGNAHPLHHAGPARAPRRTPSSPRAASSTFEGCAAVFALSVHERPGDA
jgi:hypothetical protein